MVDNPHPNSKVNENGRRYNNKAESSHSMGLADRAMHDLLPTPMSVEVYHKDRVQRAIDQGQTAFRGRPDEGKDQHPSGLMDYLHFYGMLPTPIASDFMEGTAAIRKDTGEQRMDSLKHMMAVLTIPLDENGKPDKSAAPDGGTSRLSPLFTEEMMGFPLMWTALPFLSENGEPKPSKPTATQFVRK